MTDAELDRTRRDLLALVPRVGAAGHEFFRAAHAARTMVELRGSTEFRTLQGVFDELACLIRRSAGPEDLAKIDAPRATNNPQPATGNQP